MSDLNGEKPKIFKRFCKNNKLGFLAIEYSGHGKSTGEFTKGNVTKWTNQVKKVIKRVLKKKDFILIGSSMVHGYLSINLSFFQNRLKVL